MIHIVWSYSDGGLPDKLIAMIHQRPRLIFNMKKQIDK